MNHVTEPLMSSQPIDYIHSIYEALKYRQEDFSLPYLMGVSGEAFRFSYNPFDPEAGMRTFLHNPLRTTCKALGFRHEVSYDETYQAAYERLRQNMGAGKPALLPFSDGCPFLIQGERPETLICQNGSRYLIDLGTLRAKWQPGGGFLELGPYGYYQLVLGDRERNPKGRETALGTFRCASKLMRTRRKIHNCAMGLAAYEELIAYLSSISERKKRLTEQEAYKIARWNGQPLLQCLNARKAAVEYLQSVREHFEGEELEYLDKAIAAYQKVVTLLGKLRTVLPSVSLLSDKGDDQPSKSQIHLSSPLIRLLKRFHLIARPAHTKLQKRLIRHIKADCHEAIKWVERLRNAEIAGVEALESVVRIGEKVKM